VLAAPEVDFRAQRCDAPDAVSSDDDGGRWPRSGFRLIRSKGNGARVTHCCPPSTPSAHDHCRTRKNLMLPAAALRRSA